MANIQIPFRLKDLVLLRFVRAQSSLLKSPMGASLRYATPGGIGIRDGLRCKDEYQNGLRRRGINRRSDPSSE